MQPQYLSVKGKRGKGKEKTFNLYPLTFNLFPKPNSELKILNRAVLNATYTIRKKMGLVFVIKDDDAILIVEVFNKTTRTTSKKIIEICKKRLSKYDTDQQE
ncbi:hypothetical protein [Nostoc sp. C110]|uniref:hypothetical protein n=1 Tax=Nostoc sp. C110 TaxID=3349876 RepID=UPI00370DB591